MMEMHLVSSKLILISTLLANEKEYNLALVCGVVAVCYQHHKQGATTPHDKTGLQFYVCNVCI